MKKRLGRPPKKEYDPEALMQELIDTVAEIYQEKKEIKAMALELSLPPNKVKKLLITGKVLAYPETKQIQELQKRGKTITEIQETMGLSYSALHTDLPYTKVVYKMSEISQNAALWTLKSVLLDALKLLHPYMPFITEEIFCTLNPELLA